MLKWFRQPRNASDSNPTTISADIGPADRRPPKILRRQWVPAAASAVVGTLALGLTFYGMVFMTVPYHQTMERLAGTIATGQAKLIDAAESIQASLVGSGTQQPQRTPPSQREDDCGSIKGQIARLDVQMEVHLRALEDLKREREAAFGGGFGNIGRQNAADTRHHEGELAKLRLERRDLPRREALACRR